MPWRSPGKFSFRPYAADGEPPDLDPDFAARASLEARVSRPVKNGVEAEFAFDAQFPDIDISFEAAAELQRVRRDGEIGVTVDLQPVRLGHDEFQPLQILRQVERGRLKIRIKSAGGEQKIGIGFAFPSYAKIAHQFEADEFGLIQIRVEGKVFAFFVIRLEVDLKLEYLDLLAQHCLFDANFQHAEQSDDRRVLILQNQSQFELNQVLSPPGEQKHDAESVAVLICGKNGVRLAEDDGGV